MKTLKKVVALVALSIALVAVGRVLPALAQTVNNYFEQTGGADNTLVLNGTWKVDDTSVTSTGAELNYVDVTTLGTAQASKAATLDASKGIAGMEIVGFGSLRPDNHTTLTAADVNLTKAQIQASSYFPVDVSTNAVDVDFADDAALDTADIGSEKVFMVATGHATQALTVTAGASGVTTVTTLNTIGTTCEDVGDFIRVIVRSTTAVTAMTVCAD